MAGDINVVIQANVAMFIQNIQRSTKAVRKLKEEVKKTGAASKELNKLSREASKAAQAARLLPTAMTGAAGAAGAVAYAVSTSVKAFAEWDRMMVRVAAVTNTLGTPAMQELRDTSRELAKTTEFTASQVADAMGFLGQAGFDANKVMAATPAVLQLASAGMMDVARAGDIVTNIMSGYGIAVGELEGVNNTLVATFTNSNVSLEQLGQSFKYVGPIAKAAGVDFREVSAAIGTLGNAGIQAEMAGTALRGAIARLLAPTKVQKEAMEALGVEVLQNNGKLKSLKDIVKEFEKVIERTGDKTYVAGQMMKIFGHRAGGGMVSLVNQGSKAIQDLEDKIASAGNVAEEVANAQLNSLEGQFKILKSNAMELAIALGDALEPVIRDNVKGMITFLTALQNIDGTMKGLLRAIKEVGAQLTASFFDKLALLQDPFGFQESMGIGNFFGNMGNAIRDTFLKPYEAAEAVGTNAVNKFTIMKTTAEATGRALKGAGKKFNDELEKATKNLYKFINSMNQRQGDTAIQQAFMDFGDNKSEANSLLGALSRVKGGGAAKAAQERANAMAAVENVLANDLVKAVKDSAGDLNSLTDTIVELRSMLKQFPELEISAEEIIARAGVIKMGAPNIPNTPQGPTRQTGPYTGGISLAELSAQRSDRASERMRVASEIGMALAQGNASASGLGAAAGASGSAATLALSVVDKAIGAIVAPLSAIAERFMDNAAKPMIDGAAMGAAAMIGLMVLFLPLTLTLVGFTLGLNVVAAILVGVFGGAILATVGQTETMSRGMETLSILFDLIVAAMEPFAHALLINTGLMPFLFSALREFGVVMIKIVLFLSQLGIVKMSNKQLMDTVEALAELQNATFEAAFAKTEETEEVEKATEGLREMNEELQNVPKGLKYLWRAHQNAMGGGVTGDILATVSSRNRNLFVTNGISTVASNKFNNVVNA